MRKYAHEQPDADERDLYEKLVSRFLSEDVCHCLFQVIMRTSNSVGEKQTENMEDSAFPLLFKSSLFHMSHVPPGLSTEQSNHAPYWVHHDGLADFQ